MNIKNRISKLEEWLCPAPVVPVHVMIVVPGCRMVGEKVYREDQFPAGSDVPISGALFSIPELVSECKDAKGRVFQRCFLCTHPGS